MLTRKPRARLNVQFLRVMTHPQHFLISLCLCILIFQFYFNIYLKITNIPWVHVICQKTLTQALKRVLLFNFHCKTVGEDNSLQSLRRNEWRRWSHQLTAQWEYLLLHCDSTQSNIGADWNTLGVQYAPESGQGPHSACNQCLAWL